jgi:hypothetical protein
MENDIFLMSVAILNAWRTGNVTKNYSAVIASKEFELLKTIVVPKNKFIQNEPENPALFRCGDEWLKITLAFQISGATMILVG